MNTNKVFVIALTVVMSTVMAASGAFLAWAFGAPPWAIVVSAAVLGGFSAYRFLST